MRIPRNSRRLPPLIVGLVIVCLAQHGFAQATSVKTLATRVAAPSLDGGGEWINTSGPLSLAQLRGKFVLLDFWTYCCINCIQTLPDLKKIEEKYAGQLVVIGVHSAKFYTETDAMNIEEAVLRYEIDHPVVNDARRVLWRKYEVEGWPSMRIIDPEGFIVAVNNGEATFESLDKYFRTAILSYKRKGVLDETPLRFDLERYAAEPTPLRFPGKILADEASGQLFISDSGHQRIVIAKLDGTLVDVIGCGAIGREDGSYDKASFDQPQGLVLNKGELYVADTQNHLIRKVDLAKKQVTTVAGTGEQSHEVVVRAGGLPDRTMLASPWDLWVHDNELYIAMAGQHQIWKMTLDRPRIFPFAGSGTEDIVDGPLLPRLAFQKNYAAFAQPSGLASDGRWLYVADSEGSSIRAVPFVGTDKVQTVVGTAALPDNRLFTFGDQDGTLKSAMLQHPIGVAYHDGRLFVTDTYNNKIREIDFKKQAVTTIAGDFESGDSDKPARFDEPAGLSVAGNKIYVADTNNHLVRVIDLAAGNEVTTLTIKGLEPPKQATYGQVDDQIDLPSNAKRTTFPTATIKPSDGAVKLSIDLKLPDKHRLNDLAPMSYKVEVLEGDPLFATAAVGKPVRITEPAPRLQLSVPVANEQGSAKVRVSLAFMYCAEGAEALCKIGGIEWSGQISLSTAATQDQLELTHVVR